jgi:regulator of protease activity HflC (stomatin/prohibitin superfamily)
MTKEWYVVTSVIIGLILLSIGLYIGIPLFLRYLADNGWLWVRTPEMHAVVVLKDKNLHKIILACSKEEKLAQLNQMIIGKERLAEVVHSFHSPEKMSREDIQSSLLKGFENVDSNMKYVVLPEGKLTWIGFPWLGYELFSWYENSRDDDKPEVDPHYTLWLGERTWDYSLPESTEDKEFKLFITEWGVDTADPIQVTPKLVVTVEVINPQKTLFGIKYFQEAIQKEILTAWKYAVQELEYFTYETQQVEQVEKEAMEKVELEEAKTKNGAKPKAKKELAGVSGTLQIDARERLNKFLGLPSDKEIHDDPDCQFPYKYESGKPARMVYDIYGIWLKRVRIRDIDPTDPGIREFLQKKLKAQTEAAALVEKAKGERDSQITKADGQVYETFNVGKAEADVITVKYRAKGTGLKNISDKLKFTNKENEILVAAETTIELAQKSDYTYLAGDPGNIANFALAFADRLRGGMKKIESGSKEEAQIGFAEIKKVWENLTEGQRAELAKLTEKPVEENKKGGEQNE